MIKDTKIFLFSFLQTHERRADTLTVMMTTILTRSQIYQASSKPRNFLHVLTTAKHFIIVTVTMDFAPMETEHARRMGLMMSNKSCYG